MRVKRLALTFSMTILFYGGLMTNLHAVVVTYTYDFNSNRLIRLRTPDTDNDGLPDSLEKIMQTDPNDADTDNDGIPDGVEDANQTGNAFLADSGEHSPDPERGKNLSEAGSN